MARTFASGNRIEATGATSVISTSAITISTWFRTTSFASAYGCLIGIYNAPDGDSGLKLYVKSNGKLALYVSGTGSSPNTNYDGAGSNTLSTNTWYHIAVTGSTVSNYTGYVNGSADGNQGSGFAFCTPDNVTFGDDYTTTDQPLVGTLADIGIWTTVLSAGELSALSKGARPSTVRQGSLVGYWPLDGIQSPEPDLSKNKNNGTLTGTSLSAGPPIAMFSPRKPSDLLPNVVPTVGAICLSNFGYRSHTIGM